MGGRFPATYTVYKILESVLNTVCVQKYFYWKTIKSYTSQPNWGEFGQNKFYSGKLIPCSLEILK